MSVPIIHADHVSKWYGQVIGLNDVSVDVPPGITGLLGPNGAGKSTFMPGKDASERSDASLANGASVAKQRARERVGESEGRSPSE